MTKNAELRLQVSAGHGPAECAWAVVRVLEQMQAEAQAALRRSRQVAHFCFPKVTQAVDALMISRLFR